MVKRGKKRRKGDKWSLNKTSSGERRKSMYVRGHEEIKQENYKRRKKHTWGGKEGNRAGIIAIGKKECGGVYL